MMLMSLLSLLFVVTHSNGCHSDRNTDDLPRVSCINQNLSTVPNGIDPGSQVLVLSKNHFQSLSWSLYSVFLKLHELDLSHNLITTFLESDSVLPTLRVLRLSSNMLSTLGPRTFRSAPALMEIYLDKNVIHVLDDTSFSDLPFLEVIILSQNNLQVLPPDLLKHVSSSTMKTVDLEGNYIKQLPDKFFTSKPDLPYVYLSQNRWTCNCLVMYLQNYLDDQSHNVYKHTGPISIENDPESVVCDSPVRLKGRAIINLIEDDYCSTSVSTFLYPGDHYLELISESVMETIRYLHSDSPAVSIPMYTSPTTTEPETTPMGPTSAAASSIDHPSTTEPETSNPTHATTTEPTTLKTTNPTHTTTIQPTTPIYDWMRSESWTFVSVWAITTQPLFETYLPDRLSATGPTHSTPELEDSLTASSTAPSTVLGVSGARGSQRSVPWCWWLFISFLLLCILSTVLSCILFVWLIIIYIKIYRPITQQFQTGVTLIAFQATGDENVPHLAEMDRVIFLPPEMIRNFQPVFRSVLFISKGDEKEQDNSSLEDIRVENRLSVKGNSVATKIELMPAVTLQRRGEEAAKNGKEVYRKTLYRVIAREEELQGWNEVEESKWILDENRELKQVEQKKTRYSLILREEERGGADEDSRAELEWLVGEWEMGEGAAETKRYSWGSLIRRMVRWGDTEHTRTHSTEQVTETQV